MQKHTLSSRLCDNTLHELQTAPKTIATMTPTTMTSTTATDALNVLAAADSVSATVSVLSEYADSLWTHDGMGVVRRPPSAAVKRLEKLAALLTNVVADLHNAEDVELFTVTSDTSACASGYGSLPAQTLSQ